MQHATLHELLLRDEPYLSLDKWISSPQCILGLDIRWLVYF